MKGNLAILIIPLLAMTLAISAVPVSAQDVPEGSPEALAEFATRPGGARTIEPLLRL